MAYLMTRQGETDPSLSTTLALNEELARLFLTEATRLYGQANPDATLEEVQSTTALLFTEAALDYFDELDAAAADQGEEASEAIVTEDVYFCSDMAVNDPARIASQMVTDERFSEAFNALAPLQQHLRCAALIQSVEETSTSQNALLTLSEEDAQISFAQYLAWAREYYLIDHPGTSIEQAAAAMAPLLSDHLDLYHQDASSTNENGGINPNSLLFHDSLACSELWDTAMSETAPEPTPEPEPQPLEQNQPFQLSYDDLLAMQADDQHLQCVAFLQLVEQFLVPEDFGDLNDPNSLAGLLEQHTSQMVTQFFIHNPDVNPDDASTITLDRALEISKDYLARFQHNVRTGGDMWDDALVAAEYRFCSDPAVAGDTDPGQVAPLETRPSDPPPPVPRPTLAGPYRPSYAALLALGTTEQHLHCVSFLSLMRNFTSPREHSDTIDPATLETMLDGIIRQMFHGYAAAHPEVEASDIYDILTAMTVDINTRYQERFSYNMETTGQAWDESMLMNEYAFCGTLWTSGNE